MTAKEWLGVMQQAENYNPAMTSLIIKYGEMLLDEYKALNHEQEDGYWKKRCEAAENVVMQWNSLGKVIRGELLNKWQELKSKPPNDKQ